MRMLVITRAPWRDDNNIGNTMSSFFRDMPSAEIYGLCMREQPPKNKVALRNFCISEGQLVKNILKKTPVGKENTCSTDDDGAEGKLYDTVKKTPMTLLSFARELVWQIGNWKNENLAQYIRQIDPQVIFFPVFNCWYPHKVLRHIKAISNAPVVLFHADDNYSLRCFRLSPLFWAYRLRLRKWVGSSVKLSDVNYVISEIQKNEYEHAMGVPCKILTKFADFSGEPPRWPAPQECVKMLYAGNLSSGRWKSLALVSEAAERLNREGFRVKLDIYTASPQTEAMRKKLNRKGCTVHGPVSYETVKQLQREADIVLHVEGLSLRSRMQVHQSFSTKLVDYFALGKCIFAVGTPDVASVHHLLKHDAAVVADRKEDVYKKLKALLEQPEKLAIYGEKAYLCGRAQHDEEKMKQMLFGDLQQLAHSR